MKAGSPREEDHSARSSFVRRLVQRSCVSKAVSTVHLAKPARRIIHFWNDLCRLPADVKECIDSWKTLEGQSFEMLLFDEHLARDFIRQRLGARYEKAYDKCYHPAMQSDYFRLCYIFVESGCYVDTDDVYPDYYGPPSTPASKPGQLPGTGVHASARLP